MATRIENIENISVREKTLRKAEYANRYTLYDGEGLFARLDSASNLRYKDSALYYDIAKDTLYFRPKR